MPFLFLFGTVSRPQHVGSNVDGGKQ
uniref:Uncharacterized protein n=1 Tax=Arundo donax TaxID=35708 RepID=A0A0A9HH16_ARUDO